MKKFYNLESIAVVIDEINIDTDDIIPKQFLKTIQRSGLGKFLFYNRRYDSSNNKKDNFILNQSPWDSAEILITGSNFGCGSSREHAPWALLDFGIKCIIAPSFADIFYNNSIKNGLLPLTLSKNLINILSDYSLKKKYLKVSLLDQKIYYDDISLDFTIPNDIKERLLNGYDDVELTLQKGNLINLYEKKQYNEKSWKLVDNE
ncbi:MAG: 3-isopropylmalate dehydratase small subunit 1 [Alphaproteobacteria bacterium MarineAlpha9_Bin4]|mgnify:CR=1 FL=1|nr:3-isopropylmalate dehydratase small subunit [Pelagibacterales bacterium]PPR27059.1 MAG: 3-isopropylmalate dehydratase small subunit 1 [Alphaproteobacteria bacterium MarineAlpha9_Bin4]